MATKAFQKIYTKITQITKATCSLKATGVGYDELATVNGKLAQVVKIAVYGCQLIIPYPRGFQRARGFRNLSNLSIYFLKCFCCHLIIYALRSSINSCNCL